VEAIPVIINGNKLEPREDCEYSYDYWGIAKDIKEGKLDERRAYRKLFASDSWAFMYFVLGSPALCAKLNHPFLVNACKELDANARSTCLHLWAREHFKTTAITVTQSIQHIINFPDECVGLFSSTRSIALAFLRSIKSILETSDFLKWLYPDIFYENPNKDAFRWSDDGGLYVQRKSVGRREATFEAWGLIEGMPTGKHFDLRVYDDVETMDMVSSPETIKKLCESFDMSHNLGTDGGIHRVIGTTYHHEGLLQKLRNRKKEDGESVYHITVKPATIDGTPNGAAAFLSEGKLAELRVNKQMFFSQQLLNPTPTGEQKLEFSHIKQIGVNELPQRLYKFMIIDPAGTRKERQSDSWAILVVGVEPSIDDVGASSVYLLDGVIEPMNHDDAMKSIIDLYMRNGRIQTIGVEKVAMMTTEVHISNALRARGKYVTVDTGGITLLKPGGRHKEDRIEGNLLWPLNNGKIHLVSSLSNAVIERIRIEMNRYPFWHDDGLDAMSYIFDLIKDFKFSKVRPTEHRELSLWERIERQSQRKMANRWMYV
jgi:hypothetical protein